MKIAIASVDEQTISQHFGRADKYVVLSVEGGRIIDRKIFPKPDHRQFSPRGSGNHRHEHGAGGSGLGQQARSKHEQMIENIRDCDILLTRGMGRGAYLNLQEWGIRPIVTNIPDIETAVEAVLDDTIIDHTDKLH